ncbi:MAG: translation initiation factor [Myxococcota bacterium]
MGRKTKVSTDGGAPLSSNPFASLGGALSDLPDGEPAAEPEPTPEQVPAAASGAGLAGQRSKIVVRREKKGRGGKTATVIEGLELSDAQLSAMAKQLRRRFGCGAHVEGTTVVLSGAQTDRVRDWLVEQGARKVVVGN